MRDARGAALPATQQLVKAVCVPGAGADPDRRARRGAGDASMAGRRAARAAGWPCWADGSGGGGAAPHLRRRGCRSPGSGRPRATRCWRRRAPGGRQAAPAHAQAQWAGAAASEGFYPNLASSAQRRRVLPQHPAALSVQRTSHVGQWPARAGEHRHAAAERRGGQEQRACGRSGGPRRPMLARASRAAPCAARACKLWLARPRTAPPGSGWGPGTARPAAHLLGRERPRRDGHVRRLQQLHFCEHLPILRARSAPQR